MSTTPFPVAVYTPRTPAVRNTGAAVAGRFDDLALAVRSDSLDPHTHVFLDEPTVRAKTSRLAVLAAVCALFGFLHGAGFIAGVVVGHVTLRMIKRSKGRLGGRRLACVALLVSWTPIVLVAAVFALMFLIGLQTTRNGG